ncbi:acetyl-CoA acetyltransferase [Mesorhizobium alhagi CCNWXJ12-2]|uniref:Acetyl-CoA acetyltransferase n=1 Tax=Mesorhizobium alhagi CCNWXJ12-2 TaxID=1107882 RepID=H0HWN5_9HYPH|nr:acetyl-CoA acetyltransferase [Mesorhizobium alhagi CCNWXJ12-2]
MWDAFNGYHMGNTAENVARQFQITREDQDQFALASQKKAEAAQKAGKFKDEIVAVTVKGKKGDTIVDQDEYIRLGATLDAMIKLNPAFDKDGTVTAANASGINDGAAGALLMSEAEAARRSITPLAGDSRRRSDDHGTGPIPASRKALGKAGWSVSDLQFVEANGAGLRRKQEHGLGSLNRERRWRRDRHRPSTRRLGRSHLQHAGLRDAPARGAKKGLATLCIGGGMGVAMCVMGLN